MPQHDVIDGQDFGFTTDLLLSKDDLFHVPVEIIERRTVRTPPAKAPKPVATKDAAKKAAEAEVDEGTLTFEYDGETYEIPRPENWDVGVFEAEEDGRIVVTVRLLLGTEQWDKFRTEPDGEGGRRPKRRTMKELNEIFTTATKATGTQPGE